MPFKVKATLIKFLGENGEKFPCHFGYKIGDEIIYDGEKIIGRVCEGILRQLANEFANLHVAGPRYKSPSYYWPFYYESYSVMDPSMKKYDGLGWRPIKRSPREGCPPGHGAYLIPEGAYSWPPLQERIVRKDVTITCLDPQTAALFKVEAFDLADTGFNIPHFRRQMVILDRILKKGGELEVNKILDEFTEWERIEICPTLTPLMVEILTEELALVGYLEIKDGKARITPKGIAKLEKFKESLSDEEKVALRI